MPFASFPLSHMPLPVRRSSQHSHYLTDAVVSELGSHITLLTKIAMSAASRLGQTLRGAVTRARQSQRVVAALVQAPVRPVCHFPQRRELSTAVNRTKRRTRSTAPKVVLDAATLERLAVDELDRVYKSVQRMKEDNTIFVVTYEDQKGEQRKPARR
jgi:hypothetical protein